MSTPFHFTTLDWAIIAASIAANGGRSCINASGIWTPKNADGDYLGETSRLEFVHVPSAVRLVDGCQADADGDEPRYARELRHDRALLSRTAMTASTRRSCGSCGRSSSSTRAWKQVYSLAVKAL